MLQVLFFREIIFSWKPKPAQPALISPLLSPNGWILCSPLLSPHHCCIRIMPWSASQQTRLGYEKQLLEQYFRGNRATWIDPTGNTRVEIRVTCSSNREYTLRIYIPVDFPNSCPQMVVCNPSHCLVKRNGTTMNSGNGDDHTWGSKDGCTQICHYKPADWTNDNTLYQVTMKGLIWLEAYEAHLRTGYSLSNYLQHA